MTNSFYGIGARRQHQWQKEINTLSNFCYYGLTTLLGTQTLGEEYCDLVQINQYTHTFPGVLVSFPFFLLARQNNIYIPDK